MIGLPRGVDASRRWARPDAPATATQDPGYTLMSFGLLAEDKAVV